MERRHPCRRFAGILPASLILSEAVRNPLAAYPKSSALIRGHSRYGLGRGGDGFFACEVRDE
jgi:hypothetical protein